MANKQKFVKVFKGDNWCGNWIIDGDEWFQVCLVKRDRGFVIIRQGDDDFIMVSDLLECHKAHDLFRKIKDKTSQERLKFMGFTMD